MNHFITKCTECSAVISQCRCPDPNKEVRHGKCAKCSQAPEPTQSPAKPGWLEAHNCRFNDGKQSCDCFVAGHAAGEKSGIEKCVGILQKMVKELEPSAVTEEGGTSTLYFIPAGKINALESAITEFQSLLPLDTNN